MIYPADFFVFLYRQSKSAIVSIITDEDDNMVVALKADDKRDCFASRAERDAEICHLWQDKWTIRKIIEQLSVPKSTIAYVICKNGLVRSPRYTVRQTATLAEAPIEV